MKSALGPVRAAITATALAVAIAAAAVGGLAARSSERAPATAVVPAAATSTAPAATVAAEPATAAPSTTEPAATAAVASLPPHFADGEAASSAAEGLIAPYIEAQFAIVLSDVACSQPPTGAEGDEFVCYGLKEGDLVVALRATIGAEQLITLDLIANQEPTTTAPPPTSTVESSIAG